MGVFIRKYSESKDLLHKDPALMASLKRAFLIFVILLIIVSLLLLILLPQIALRIILYTAFLMGALIGFSYMNISLLKTRKGGLLRSFGAANYVTVFRILLIPSISVLLFNGILLSGTLLYVLGAFLDIVDGAVARRLKQESMLGVILDPVGDIATTFIAFLFLWNEELVPDWLFVLLIVRYAQFFFGLAALALLKSTPGLRATLAGKVAAVVQGLAISTFLFDYSLSSINLSNGVVIFEYYVLAFVFLWVIISQSVIGYRALKSKQTSW